MKIALASCRDLPGWEVDDQPLHEALKSRGVEVATPPWDDEDFAWSDQDGILIRTTWDYWNRRDEFVSWALRVSRHTPLYNGAPVIAWNTDKRYLKALDENGVSIAPTVWIDKDTRPDVAKVMEERGWSRGFLKPVIGAAASDTLRFFATQDGLAAAEEHLNSTLDRVPMMLQPYLSRVEDFGEVSFLYFGGEFSHAVQKIPVGGDYRVQDDFGAKDMVYDATSAEIEMAQRAIQVAEDICPGVERGELLYARVDYLKDDEDRWILTELELVEPSLFFRHHTGGGDVLAKTLIERIVSAARQ